MTTAIQTFPFLPLLFGVMVSAALVSFLLRRWLRPVALGGALLAGALALWVWQVDFTRPIFLLPNNWGLDLAGPVMRFGFTAQLQQANLAILVINLSVTAGALLLAARLGQDESLPALAWLLATGYSLLGLLTTSVVMTPLVLMLLTALSIFALQGGRDTRQNGLLGVLVAPILATPLYLLAAWYSEQAPLNPQDTGLTATAGLLLGLGTLILLLPFPLHTPRPASAQAASPVAVLLVWLLYELAVLHLTAQVINRYPFVLQQTAWPTWLSWLGLLTAVWGGMAALATVHAGRLWGYAALYDWGLIIIVMAAPGVRSWTLVLFLFALRTISMFTAGAGLTTLEQHLGGLEIERLRGAGSRLPWNSAAFLLGGLGLIGFPLSAGFAGHWAALLTVASIDWRPAAVVTIAAGVAVVAFVRVARALFGQTPEGAISRENSFSIALAVAALVITLAVALAPQLLDPFISRALSAFG